MEFHSHVFNIFRGEGEHVHFSTSNSYLYDPFYYGFGEEDMATFEENQTYLAIGCEKAIHTVQGPPSGQLQHDVGVPALVVQRECPISLRMIKFYF